MHNVGYTTGVFDLFHIGHLNLLKNAASQCQRLIVGVTTDELTLQLKKKPPVIPFVERIEIVRHIVGVHSAVAEETDDKIAAWERLGFDVVFKGDDWKNTPKWNHLEEQFAARKVSVVYFPYTSQVSTARIQRIIADNQ